MHTTHRDRWTAIPAPYRIVIKSILVSSIITAVAVWFVADALPLSGKEYVPIVYALLLGNVWTFGDFDHRLTDAVLKGRFVEVVRQQWHQSPAGAIREQKWEWVPRHEWQFYWVWTSCWHTLVIGVGFAVFFALTSP